MCGYWRCWCWRLDGMSSGVDLFTVEVFHKMEPNGPKWKYFWEAVVLVEDSKS